MNKLKRYLLFLIGLFINALGVSLVTKASLGTSPISSIPYVLSLKFPAHTWKFHHHLQYSSDLAADPDSEKEF